MFDASLCQLPDEAWNRATDASDRVAARRRQVWTRLDSRHEESAMICHFLLEEDSYPALY